MCFDIYSKYAQAVLLKDSTTITSAFQNILDESSCKSNKVWVDEGNQFYNRSIKSCLQDNYTETCSIHNKGKYVVVERFIRTLKYEMYKYVTLVSKNVYINK